MKSENKQNKKQNTPSTTAKNNYDIDIQACSTTELTGLIPAIPETESELEAYEDIYPYLPHAKSTTKD